MGLLSSVLDFVGGGIGAVGGISGILQDTANTAIEQKNYELMKDQQMYEKAIQKEAWVREDNAVTRRVADLRRAGLNPVLAAGSSAQSSAPIHLTTPQRGLIESGTGFDRLQQGLAMLTQKAEISRVTAQNELLNLQKEKVKQETRKVTTEADSLARDLDIDKSEGSPTHAPMPVKAVAGLSHMVKQKLNAAVDWWNEKREHMSGLARKFFDVGRLSKFK